MCGRCKAQFSSLNDFVNHKKVRCGQTTSNQPTVIIQHAPMQPRADMLSEGDTNHLLNDTSHVVVSVASGHGSGDASQSGTYLTVPSSLLRQDQPQQVRCNQSFKHYCSFINVVFFRSPFPFNNNLSSSPLLPFPLPSPFLFRVFFYATTSLPFRLLTRLYRWVVESSLF